MKYMQEGGFQNNPLMRLTLGLTLALLLGFWATNVAMYFSRMSLKPSSVVTYYNGSEEDFRAPRSAGSMLETTHMHLPMMGMVLLLLTHLAIFVPMSRGARVGLILTAFGSAVFEEGARLARPLREPCLRPPQGNRLCWPAGLPRRADRGPRALPPRRPSQRGPEREAGCRAGAGPGFGSSPERPARPGRGGPGERGLSGAAVDPPREGPLSGPAATSRARGSST